MNHELLKVLSLLLVTIGMFVANKPRMDVVALIMIAAFPFTGILTINEAIAGFSNPSVVLIAALFVLGDGLVRTGVAKKLGDWLVVKANNSEIRLIGLLMAVVCILGTTMSTTAITAIFIPVVMRICQRTGTAPSRLMMPLSVAALTSGMTTLIATTPNLVVNSELQRQGLTGFKFFSITPFGVPIIILAIAYMILSRHRLTSRNDTKVSTQQKPSFLDWIDTYKLSHREFRLRLTKRSPIVGKILGELELSDIFGMNILAIERRQRFTSDLLQPTLKRKLLPDDIILVDLCSDKKSIEEIKQDLALVELPFSGAYLNDISQEIGMAELIIPDGSQLAGSTAVASKFRSRTGLTIIGLRRGNVSHGQKLLEEVLQVGDTLLVIGTWNDIHRLNPDESGALTLRLPTEINEALPVAGKMYQSLACLALAVGLMASGLVANVHAALIGCLMMGATKCIDLTSVYRSIEWKTIMLVVGMIPFSIALQRTGGVDLAVSALKAITNGGSPSFTLATLFIITMTLAMLISNTATAILMAPIAITLALELGVSPYPFAMIVCLASSTAFMTPVASPVNMLVLTPGNYTFADFVRIGTPFALIVMLVSVFLVPWLLPF